MPRARISAKGVEIAKPGYDVDTAGIANMLLSPQFSILKVAQSGTVTVAPFSGYMDSDYYAATVNFPSAFIRPPLVMVAGLNGDGSTDQTAAVLSYASDQSGRAWIFPMYEIEVTTSKFDLYVKYFGGDPNSPYWYRTTTWKYWVFNNTLDP